MKIYLKCSKCGTVYRAWVDIEGALNSFPEYLKADGDMKKGIDFCPNIFCEGFLEVWDANTEKKVLPAIAYALNEINDNLALLDELNHPEVAEEIETQLAGVFTLIHSR